MHHEDNVCIELPQPTNAVTKFSIFCMNQSGATLAFKMAVKLKRIADVAHSSHLEPDMNRVAQTQLVSDLGLKPS